MNLPDLSAFNRMPFPANSEIVYVLCADRPGAQTPLPFYVGQSSRSFGRFGDYQAAKFSAATDFKVGRVVARLHERGVETTIFYKPSSSRLADERALVNSYRAAGVELLNNIEGYDYKIANEAEELGRIHAYADRLSEQLSR